MRHSLTLMTRTRIAICSIFSFVLVTFSCTISDNQDKKSKVAVKAEAIPEGICLNFKNIPHDSTRLSIGFMDMDDTFFPRTGSREYTAFAEISGNLLDNVKQTGKVIFPFVRKGHKYNIFTSFKYDYFNDEGIHVNFDVKPSTVIIDFTAENGININNEVALDVNKNYTGVTLSHEPIFSLPVKNDIPKYNYSVEISRTVSENESFGMTISDRNEANFLHWNFKPIVSGVIKDDYYIWYYRDFLKQEGDIIVHWENEPLSDKVINWFNKLGQHTAYVTAFSNLIYDNISWKVEIAKSPVFDFYLND
jgi:hypothetical protein